MNIAEALSHFNQKTEGSGCQLIAVSKTKPIAVLVEAYQAGQKHFGENKVQEMCDKQAQLPSDICWHMIGHLQSNKVKYIAPFVYLIHSVDTLKLLQEINKQGQKANRIIPCLLQVHIASEESKFGFSEMEIHELLSSASLQALPFIKIMGLMGMATNTENQELIRKEFRGLKSLFEDIKSKYSFDNLEMKEISMGMSGDCDIAIEEGSTLIRVGSALFGGR